MGVLEDLCSLHRKSTSGDVRAATERALNVIGMVLTPISRRAVLTNIDHGDGSHKNAAFQRRSKPRSPLCTERRKVAWKGVGGCSAGGDSAGGDSAGGNSTGGDSAGGDRAGDILKASLRH